MKYLISRRARSVVPSFVVLVFDLLAELRRSIQWRVTNATPDANNLELTAPQIVPVVAIFVLPFIAVTLHVHVYQKPEL